VSAVTLSAIVEYLDGYLRVADVPDSPTAANGLQVENGGAIGWVVAAVDATQATIDGVVAAARTAPARGSPLLLVHHGLFWDGSLPVTGRRYRRLRRLLEHDIAVYSAHLPLDLHPEVGNNARLAALLGLRDPRPFAEYKGALVGLYGEAEFGRDDLAARLERELGGRVHLIPGGPERTGRIGVITGAASGQVEAACAAGCDTFVTGEGMHHTHFDAMESGVNVLFAGHYATEQLGVKALAAHLQERFGLPWEFHDHPTGL
jgi:dinuclear metal center YbgI/SA1388 family protein